MNTQIIRPPAYQKPSGAMRLDIAQDNILSGYQTRILLDKIDQPTRFIDGIEDVTNHQIKPLTPGIYMIWGQVTFKNIVADKFYEAIIYIASATEGARLGLHGSHDQLLTVPVFCVLWLSGNQEVSLEAQHNAGVDTIDIACLQDAGHNRTFLRVQRVR